MAAAELVPRMIIGMAGHVDHGKSALVTALTGRPMDRLAEERRRGITIDLNFAPVELAPGIVAGMVDVPGHEDFVRTMVAGASGIDAAILVVAASEGIMPQTREHLLVLEQLGVPAGVAVITKADTVEPAWLELVRAELIEWLADSTVAFAAPIVTSARSGQGIAEVRARLAALAGAIRQRDADDLFRLPIDRVFTIAGSGTVVTGSAVSGSIAVGDLVRILPSDIEARVRSIESHGTTLDRSRAGMRTALALSGAGRGEISRGEVAVRAADAWKVSRRLDVVLSVGREAAAGLKDRDRVRVHLGTAEVLATVRVTAGIPPGEAALARIDLDGPVVARGDDPLVLRSLARGAVIGGGRILDPLGERRRGMPAVPAQASGGARLEAVVQRRRHGLEVALLPQVLGTSPAACAALVGRTPGVVVVGTLAVTRVLVQDVAQQLEQAVAGFHRAQPHAAGMSLETLRHALQVPGAIVDAALALAMESRRLVMASGLAAVAGFRPDPELDADEIGRLVAAVHAGGLTAPGVADLSSQLGLPRAAAGLRAAAARGEVLLVEPGRYLSAEALAGFVRVLREVGTSAPITPGALRERTGLSRKYLIPLLEWADRSGFTLREGDARRLRPSPHAAASRA